MELLTAPPAPLLPAQAQSLTTRKIRYIVSLSSGASSAVAAQRTIDRYGRENVELVFMDVRREHGDNYRFLRDLENRFGAIITLTDGRTPEQVWDERKLIPNSLLAPCTSTLKIRLFVNYCKQWQAQGYKVVAVLGYNYRDSLPRPGKPQGRLDEPIKNYGKLGIEVEYPLLWPKNICYSPQQEVMNWGLQLPKMYTLGFTSANCSGDCPKAGISHWRRVLREFPTVYAHREQWETNKRLDPQFAKHAMLKRSANGVAVPFPLRQLREETERALSDIQTTVNNMLADEATKAKMLKKLTDQQWRKWLMEDDLEGDSCTTNECGVGNIDEYIQTEMFAAGESTQAGLGDTHDLSTHTRTSNEWH